jgi:hypothetical protein
MQALARSRNVQPFGQSATLASVVCSSFFEANRLVEIKSHLAGYDRHGKVWMNPHVPSTFRRIKMRKRLRIHEQTEIRERKKLNGGSLIHSPSSAYPPAHNKALKAEHRGLSPHSVQIYEGMLGSVARWHPMNRGRKTW